MTQVIDSTEQQAAMASDIRVIKGWVTFFGILAIIALIAGIIIGAMTVHYVDVLNQTVQNGSTFGSNCIGFSC